MEQLKAFFQMTFYNNTIEKYISVLLVFLICIIIIELFDKLVLRRLERMAKKTKGTLDDLVVFIFRKSVPMFYIVVFYISIHTLNLSNRLKGTLTISMKIIVVLYIVYILSVAIDWAAKQYLKGENVSAKARSLRAITNFMKLIVYVFAFVLLLNNLNINVSALLTGIGITGIAVALAAQTILSDLFSYFTIIFDRPFEEGDFITFGDFSGTVKHIGLKSTRVRSLSGEEIIVSNTDLTGSRVRNYKRMKQRRVVFQFGVTYNTPGEKLRKIPSVVKNIIDEIKGATFGRTHFVSFGDFSLNFEVAYYVISRDYQKYMDIQQEINLKITEEFKKKGIDFAYPTQVVYLTKNGNK